MRNSTAISAAAAFSVAVAILVIVAATPGIAPLKEQVDNEMAQLDKSRYLLQLLSHQDYKEPVILRDQWLLRDIVISSRDDPRIKQEHQDRTSNQLLPMHQHLRLGQQHTTSEISEGTIKQKHHSPERSNRQGHSQSSRQIHEKKQQSNLGRFVTQRPHQQRQNHEKRYDRQHRRKEMEETSQKEMRQQDHEMQQPFPRKLLNQQKQLIVDPSIEKGGQGWIPVGGSALKVVESKVIFVYNRQHGSWEGIGVNMKQKMKLGSTYAISAWFGLADNSTGIGRSYMTGERNGSPESAERGIITVRRKDGNGSSQYSYTHVGSRHLSGDRWTLIEGEFTLDLPPNQVNIHELTVFFEGPSVNTNFLLGNVSIKEKENVQNVAEMHELLDDPYLENEGVGWFPIGGTNMKIINFDQYDTSDQTEQIYFPYVRTGSKAMLIHDRQSGSWQGIGLNMKQKMIIGSTYEISAWFRLTDENNLNFERFKDEEKVKITARLRYGSGDAPYEYIHIASRSVTSNGWTLVRGNFVLHPPPKCAVTHDIDKSIYDLVVYFEGPSSGINFLIDDASITEAKFSNLHQNPGFEDGNKGWFPRGLQNINVQSEVKLNGDYALMIDASERSERWHGVGTNLLKKMMAGKTYKISAWCRTTDSSDHVYMTIKQIDDRKRFIPVSPRNNLVSSSGWKLIEGNFSLQSNAEIRRLVLYFEGPSPNIGFYVDDVRIVEQPDWKAETDASIDFIRKRNATIEIKDATGAPLSGATVTINQKRRHFAFGTAINERLNYDEKYQTFVKENFEWAVPENEAKWYSNEPHQYNLQYEGMDKMLDFCRANDIKVRGHAVFWADERMNPHWLHDLSQEELWVALDSRVKSVVGRYAGQFLHWDVNNEMLIKEEMGGEYFERRLGTSVRKWMFDQVKHLDPSALTFVNEYNIIVADYGLVDEYKSQIQELMDAGAVIDGIGVQGHFWRSLNVDGASVTKHLDSLSELGLPIWITEFDTTDEDENIRAQNLEVLYRTAFAHPAVEGILMWGFWAGSHWRGPDAAIVDEDWTINAAGHRYQSLMDEWKTFDIAETDSDGKVSFRGFHGKYEVSVEALESGIQSVHEIYLHPGFGSAIYEIQSKMPKTTLEPSEDGHQKKRSRETNTV